MSMEQEQTRRFVTALLALAPRPDDPDRRKQEGNRAALAALRRGLGKAPGAAPEVFRYVVPNLDGVARSQEWAYYAVASLFALHPLHWVADAESGAWPGERNFGASMRRLKEARLTATQVRDDAGSGETPVERRFVALLNSDAEDLEPRLRHAVSLFKSATPPIQVDWIGLLRDLLLWNDASRKVQRDWAGQFWRERHAATSAPQGDETNDDES